VAIPERSVKQSAWQLATRYKVLICLSFFS
jgi:hypothetical protein